MGRRRHVVGRAVVLAGLGLCLQLNFVRPASGIGNQVPTSVPRSTSTTTTTSTTSTSTSTTTTTIPRGRATAAPVVPTAEAEPDPVDAWAWNRIAPVLLSSFCAAGVALLVSWQGNRRAEDRFRSDQRRSIAFRRADRLKEATVAVSEVAQVWRETIERVLPDAADRRESWAALRERQAFLETEVPRLRAKVEEYIETLDGDHQISDVLRGATIEALKRAQAVLPLCEGELEEAPARLVLQAEDLQGLVASATRGLSSRWVHVRGQAELMAPGLMPQVVEVQGALEAWAGEMQVIERPVPTEIAMRVDRAHGALIAEALRQIELLEAPIEPRSV